MSLDESAGNFDIRSVANAYANVPAFFGEKQRRAILSRSRLYYQLVETDDFANQITLPDKRPSKPVSNGRNPHSLKGRDDFKSGESFFVMFDYAIVSLYLLGQ